MRGSLVVVLALMVAHAPAYADATAPDSAPDGELGDDVDLGPVITIEAITVEGNTATRAPIIRRALPLVEGDTLKASDPRLRDARFKLLALGFFRDVTIGMRKGSARGRVILDVTVVERGTLVLNKLWYGTSDFATNWGGLDVGDRNFLGLGLSIGAGAVYASHGQPDQNGASDSTTSQSAAELRVGASAIRGSRWSIAGSITTAHGNDYHPSLAGGFLPFEYKRLTGRIGTSYDITPLARLSAQLRTEQITNLDEDPTGSALDRGDSHVNTLAVAFDHDTRRDPILPHAGTRTALVFEGSTRALPLRSDYTFSTLFAHVEHWFPLRNGRTAIGLRASGGHVFGNAPRFDYIYLNDIDPMLAPRALGLLLSTAQPIRFLRDERLSPNGPALGTSGGLASVEVTTQLFRGPGKRRVYGGDLFFSAGVWALDIPTRAQPSDLYVDGPRGTVADLYVDAGIRLDTEIGIFELSVGNALGRVR